MSHTRKSIALDDAYEDADGVRRICERYDALIHQIECEMIGASGRAIKSSLRALRVVIVNGREVNLATIERRAAKGVEQGSPLHSENE